MKDKPIDYIKCFGIIKDIEHEEGKHIKMKPTQEDILNMPTVGEIFQDRCELTYPEYINKIKYDDLMNKYFANQKELLTVASIIFAEVEWNDDIILLCESIKAIIKVGVNRLKNPVRYKCKKGKDRYTLYDIFTAKGQFSCYPASNQFQKAQNGLITDFKEFKMWLEIINILFCTQVITGYINTCIPIITSNHYYNPNLCSPNWAKDVPVDYVIGNHNFLTL